MKKILSLSFSLLLVGTLFAEDSIRYSYDANLPSYVSFEVGDSAKVNASQVNCYSNFASLSSNGVSSTSQVSLSGLTPGTYFIKLLIDGALETTQQLIIQ